MLLSHEIVFRVQGAYGLFTDPLTKIGGEKSSYMVPTYQALKGICESIYWKPSIRWVIDEVIIENMIRTESKGIRTMKYHGGGNDLSFYTYLYDVSYVVAAHFEFNELRSDLQHDFDMKKHFAIAQKAVRKGGRRDIYLGTKECQGFIEPCEFSNANSFYKDIAEIPFGLMYHSLIYPDENAGKELISTFDQYVMRNGIITFEKPENVRIQRKILKRDVKRFTIGVNMKGIDEEYQEVCE